MAKATVEGGASNAAVPWTCAECGAQVAPGAPRCPECPSTGSTQPEPAAEDAVSEAEGGDAEPSPPAVPPRRTPPPAGM